MHVGFIALGSEGSLRGMPTLGDRVTLVTNQHTKKVTLVYSDLPITAQFQPIMVAGTKQAHHPKARYFSAHAAKPSVAFFSSQPPELHREPKTRRRRGEPMVLPMYFSNPRRTGCGQCNQPSNQHSQM